MKYDLTVKEDRAHFVRYANRMLQKQRTCVSLYDESGRTLNQNSYIHVLCRILAQDIGVSEEYAKQVYFKDLANHDIFFTATKDEITGGLVTYIRSTADLKIPEMRKAISNFLSWAAENKYYLPEANVNDDGTMSFSTDKDRQAFHQAEILTSKDD